MAVCAATDVVKVDLRGKPFGPLLAIALFDTCIYYVCETMGISLTTATESGIFLACIPVMSLLASTLTLKRRPSHR